MPSNVSVTISADDAELRAKLALSQSALKDFNKQVRDLADDMRAASGTARDELEKELQGVAAQALGAQREVSKFKSELAESSKTGSGAFSELKLSAESFQGSLRSALAGGEFLVFKELAEQAFEAVKALFESTVAKAIEFDLSLAKFAQQMGETTQEAAGLAEALKAVGSSSDAYVGMALKLDRQVKTNEASLKAFGMATRDSNGELLSQSDLMRNAISTMEQYKAGSDQNTVALTFFGRGAREVYDVMLVTDALTEQYTEHLSEMGVSTMPQAAKNSLDLKLSMATLSATFEDFGIALGQHIGPEFKVLIDYMSQIAGPVLNALRVAAEGAFAGIDTIIEFNVEIIRAWYGTVKEVINAAVLAFHVLRDGVTGNWSQISTDLSADWGRMKTQFDSTLSGMEESASSWAARMKTLMSGPQGGGAGLYASGPKSAPDLEGIKKFTEEMNKATEANGRLQTQVDRSILSFTRMSQELTAGALRSADAIDNKMANAFRSSDQDIRKMQADAQKATEQQNKQWIELGSTITSSFGSAISGLIKQTETWQQAMASIFDAVLDDFIKMVAKMIEEWALLSVFGITPQIGTAATGLGNFLGIFATGTDFVPKDGMAYLHKGEIVVPAAASAMIRSGGGISSLGTGSTSSSTSSISSSGGDTHINLNVQAVDAGSVQRLFMQQGSALVRSLKEQIRNGNGSPLTA